MEPVTTAAAASTAAPWIIGGANVLGAGITSALGFASAERQMSFQERMATTQVQRQVKDMEAAGINPILAAKLGGNAAPPGASAQVGDLSRVGSDAVSSAYSLAQINQVQALTEKTRAEAALVKMEAADKAGMEPDRLMAQRAAYMDIVAQLEKTRSETSLNDWQRQSIIQQMSEYETRIKQVNAQIEQTLLQNTHSALDLERSTKESKFWKGWGGDLAPYLQNLGGTAKGIAEGLGRSIPRGGRVPRSAPPSGPWVPPVRTSPPLPDWR